jgi:guanosine-3',5'-bis(diphosphate) 3'-pyrophosphohydrolase
MLEKKWARTAWMPCSSLNPAQAAAERCNYPTVEDLLAGLGYGEVTLNLVVNRCGKRSKSSSR